MCLLNAAFLAAPHRITVIDAGPLNSMDAGFQPDRVAKLSAAVRQDDLKERQE